MKHSAQKYFIANGLLLLLLAMVFPFYSPWARAQEGIVVVHLVGVTEAVLCFAFAWFWGMLNLPKWFSKLAIILFTVSLWMNGVSFVVTFIVLIFVILQTFVPSISNG